LKTHKKNQCIKPVWLLVLVPHRDTRLVLRKWSADLFRAGFCGAYSFPWVAPLALLSRPLGAEELKSSAGFMREESMRANKGKIIATGLCSAAIPAPHCARGEAADAAILGPCINVELPHSAFIESAGEKVISLFSPQIIGACLLLPGEDNLIESAALPPPPQLSFRAAALANMSWLTMRANDSYKWEIEKLSWLPPVNSGAQAHL